MVVPYSVLCMGLGNSNLFCMLLPNRVNILKSMELAQQKNILPKDFPFDLFLTDINGYPPHWHEAMEMVYLMEGSLDMAVNDRLYHLTEGDLLILHPGDVHHFLQQSRGGHRIIIQFEPSLLGALREMVSHHRFESPHFSSRNLSSVKAFQQLGIRMLDLSSICRSFKNEAVMSYKNLQTYFRRVLPDFHKGSNRLDALLLSMVYLENSAHAFLPDRPLWTEEEVMDYRLNIMTGLYRLFRCLFDIRKPEVLSSGERSRQTRVLQRLRLLFSWVEQHYREPVGLDDAAEALHVSRYHFSRFFKQATGMSFIRYLNRYRVSVAVNHLLYGNDSVQEIAYLSGFNSPKTFNRVFRDIQGCSPSSFRRNSKN